MLIVFGWQKYLKNICYVVKKCFKCESNTVHLLKQGKTWFHIIMIPLIPFSKRRTFEHCNKCNKALDVTEEIGHKEISKNLTDLYWIGCPNCNKTISIESKNCTHCNYLISDTERENVKSTYSEFAQLNLLKQKKSEHFLFGCLSSLLIFFLLMTIWATIVDYSNDRLSYTSFFWIVPIELLLVFLLILSFKKMKKLNEQKKLIKRNK